MTMIFITGGIGNVVYQVNQMTAMHAENWSFSELLYSPFLMKTLGHTQTVPSLKLPYSRLNNYISLLYFSMLLLDRIIFKIFGFTLVTRFDSTLIKSRPLISPLIYYGYFQENFECVESYYFCGYKDVFNVPPAIYVKAPDISERYVVVQVRGGDYIKAAKHSSKSIATNMPLLDINWYALAITELERSLVGLPIYFVTDDITACSEVMNCLKVRFPHLNLVLRSSGVWEDLELMSNAQGLIIFNSTFGALALTESEKRPLCITTKYMENKNILKFGVVNLKVLNL